MNGDKARGLTDQATAQRIMRDMGIVLGPDDSRSAVQYLSEMLPTTEVSLGEMALCDVEKALRDGENAVRDEERRFTNPGPLTSGQIQAHNLTANVRPHTV